MSLVWVICLPAGDTPDFRIFLISNRVDWTLNLDPKSKIVPPGLLHSGALLLLKCNTRRDLLNQEGWKCTLSKSTKLILVSSCKLPDTDTVREFRENMFWKLMTGANFICSIQHNIAGQEIWAALELFQIWARKIDIAIPFKSSHSSKPKRRRQRYVLFTGLVKIFHGAVAILNQPHPVLTEFQRYYFGTQCNLVFCDLVFE